MILLYKVLLGVCGGIAAYKSAELARLMVKEGYEVKVVMTPAATKFLSPLTFHTLTGNPVGVELFDSSYTGKVKHIDLASYADIIVVAPTTANTLGKVAAGIADNLLTNLLLAASVPTVLLPSMNENMYQHRAVQRNIKYLRSWGYHLLEPTEGDLACKWQGKGRMPEPADIMSFIKKILERKLDYLGVKALVTAGPTREALDPVRFISNRSSGKMGYAVAQALRDRGAEVCLISGPSELDAPAGVEIIRVESTQEMFEQAKELFSQVDLVIKAAAVSDYVPISRGTQKSKKQDFTQVELKKTEDILKWMGENKETQVLVGFAAETEEVKKYAFQKMRSKNLDIMVANDVSEKNAGFASDTNRVMIVSSEGEVKEWPLLDKLEVGHRILDEVLPLLTGI